MTDRELLELAAKAAGYDVLWHDMWECFVHTNSQNHTNPEVWIPLDDDGDALRLAVTLNLTIKIYGGNTMVYDMDDKYLADFVDCETDTATRRAIVRAASLIGEKL